MTWRKCRNAKTGPWEGATFGAVCLGLLATIGAGCLCLLETISQSRNPLENIGFSDRSVVEALGEIAAETLVRCLIVVIIALIGSGIISASQKRFFEAYSRTYSIGVLIVAVVSLFGNFISSDNPVFQSNSSRRIEAESVRKTLSGIEDDLQSVIKASEGPDGLPRKVDFQFKNETPATDDMQKARELIQSYFNEMMAVRNEYAQALMADGINNLLDPGRIAKDKEFKDSRLVLFKVKRTMADARAKTLKILADFPNRVKDYKFSPVADQGLLEGCKRGALKGGAKFEELWDLEVEMLSHLESLIDHLEQAREHWSTDQGEFIFERECDIEKFNEIMGKITKCGERQKVIRETAMKSSLEDLRKIKENIPR